ncbi:delta-class carbonic anhydrase [Mariprofundus sp. KV]|uniref:delta-class carbonic anhydrase n=1 Tax=Mariprofundus sp. KV TaxID=2608715 RepID=UPI0015A4084C|nr:delta-class carbonic anhydrase [Mariprofundus sp. KV]NWF36602.1 hypothetical protein [Mariprofundus sp. KV]
MKHIAIAMAVSALLAAPAFAGDHGGHGNKHGAADAAAHGPVADKVIAAQRKALAKSTKGAGFGPQSPRDIDSAAGNNNRIFSEAPASTTMNLCNIHFHKNAEHKGGEFTIYAGNGDGHGYQSGYRYDTAKLSAAELAPTKHEICPSAHGSLSPGDTIEVHYVHSTAQIKPGPTLGSCLSESIGNPQLRVETQVYVLVNDKHAANFKDLAAHKKVNGLHQPTGIPSNTGTPVQYEGSTTGPGYNEKGSPYQVSWSVRPQVAKVNIDSVGKWCKGNTFNEDHAHGVRNLVQNKNLLSTID